MGNHDSEQFNVLECPLESLGSGGDGFAVPSRSPPRFTQVSEYWPFFQLFLFNQARHKPFGGSSDAFRIHNEKIPSALNFSFFSTLLLVQSAFFSLSQGASGDPEFLVSSSYLLFLVS